MIDSPILMLDYKGQELPYLQSYYALSFFEKEKKKPYSKIDYSDQDDLEILAWGSLVSGHAQMEKKLEVQRSEVSLILDWCYPQMIDFGVKKLKGAAKKKSRRAIIPKAIKRVKIFLFG